MQQITLVQIALFLAAAAIAAPLAKRLQVGAVLGYLVAGIFIGPYGIGNVVSIYNVESILRIAEFGVVLLLFLIGLELRPVRLWSMRSSIFGLGGAQFFITGVFLSLAGYWAGFSTSTATLLGFALSLSSTAFALQILEEKGELTARHGRLSFSILLFQDLAAIPLLAIVPLLAVFTGIDVERSSVAPVFWAIGTIVLVILIGKYLLDRLFKLVAATDVKEAMTASALLTVVGVALLMEWAGLSAALGAFIAGALLADSSFRHQIQADIAPFEGLLMGLFFTAIGMSLNFGLLMTFPAKVMMFVGALLVIKFCVLYLLGRWWKLDARPSRRLALVLSQGGEFGFVIFGLAAGGGIIERGLADLLALSVTLSMAATPLLLLIDEAVTKRRKGDEPEFITPPENTGHVIIAGFGRMGQITARVLQAKQIPYTGLDVSSAQVDFVRKFGNKIYYGDSSRLEVLKAVNADRASAFVLAVDDVEASLKTAAVVRRHFPDLTIYARAQDRQHVHRLLDLGVEHIHREAFLSSLELTREVLFGIGLSYGEAEDTIETFREHDNRRLYDDYKHYTDMEKLRDGALSSAKELEELFVRDAVVQPLKPETDKE